jgi:hypothetical protein
MYGDVQNARGFKQEKTAGGRKVVDMGAPIFVKAGTLFADEDHQPDNTFDPGTFCRRKARLLTFSGSYRLWSLSGNEY